MKDLHGEAAGEVAAPPQRCLDLLGDLESYPRWYPEVVRQIEVLERDGATATRARVTLHAAVGPINRDLQLVLSVARADDRVTLARVSHGGSDRERFEVRWRAVGGPQGPTRLQVTLDAALDLPRMLPIGGLADSMAAGFVAAAVRELS